MANATSALIIGGGLTGIELAAECTVGGLKLPLSSCRALSTALQPCRCAVLCRGAVLCRC